MREFHNEILLQILLISALSSLVIGDLIGFSGIEERDMFCLLDGDAESKKILDVYLIYYY